MPQLTDWISACSAAVSAGATFVTIWMTGLNWKFSQKSEAQAELFEQRKTSLIEFQAKIQGQAWIDSYFRDLLEWSHRVADNISCAIHEIDCPDAEEKRRVLAALSVSIDTGRWYFPNKDHDLHGIHKEPAYRGLRQPILDWLVYAYRVYAELEKVDNKRRYLVHCQRNFVSIVQGIVDPRSRDKSIKKVFADFEAVGSLPDVGRPDR